MSCRVRSSGTPASAKIRVTNMHQTPKLQTLRAQPSASARCTRKVMRLVIRGIGA